MLYFFFLAAAIVSAAAPFGPDVSHYQGSVDWPKVAKSGVGFAIAKATEGLTYVDSQFAANWKGMSANGIKVKGAYHFGHPAESASNQASHFVSVVGSLKAGEFLVLDIEAATLRSNMTEGTVNATGAGGMSPASVAEWCKDFVDAVCAKSGLPVSRVWIYTGAWFWNPQAGGSGIVGNHPLWVSGYTSAPPMPKGWSKWTMWQYTDKATISGVANPCDASRFNGDQASLEKLVGL
mmetsp:Transcript_33849/g.66589  ORF Transcript_33849/g.66589 Transcript_33849/m.66589 type:complete len:236 (+) Transcript_33849:34-741(+)|eukprot:CAMPEP_0175151060 /NCGR_PEP_ID=MMETSP0087-20121206/18262_1 /TAXON_ID=136419 /ORGANISM="Unknown Unknown, Strain D1" /LENGTH=235 /DNA_ID=CAMNT_0016437167 /DNA_START=27 /DNA_END=734 /DNA_ORIENTATION=+